MAIFRSIGDSNRNHWIDASQWLCWNVICGLMPIWLPIIFRYLFGQGFALSLITEHGEFALYSASFLGTTLYIVLRDVNTMAFPDRPIIAPLLIILLLISTALYAAPMLADIFLRIGIKEPYNLLDKEKLIYYCTILLIFVIIFSFIIFVIDLVRAEPDLRNMITEQLNNLSEQFDEIQGE